MALTDGRSRRWTLDSLRGIVREVVSELLTNSRSGWDAAKGRSRVRRVIDNRVGMSWFGGLTWARLCSLEEMLDGGAVERVKR